jgi:hypothetical protein
VTSYCPDPPAKFVSTTNATPPNPQSTVDVANKGFGGILPVELNVTLFELIVLDVESAITWQHLHPLILC